MIKLAELQFWFVFVFTINYLFKIVLVQKASNISEESLYQRDCYTKEKKTQSGIYWNYASWWRERYKRIMKCVYQQHTKYHSSQLRGTGKKRGYESICPLGVLLIALNILHYEDHLIWKAMDLCLVIKAFCLCFSFCSVLLWPLLCEDLKRLLKFIPAHSPQIPLLHKNNP